MIQNQIGFITLYKKEIRRFIKVYMQTVVAPMVTTLLFLAVFVLALGRGGHTIAGVPFVQFLLPGLVMMAVVQNAFANTSSSLIIAKVNGNITDTLLPPLNAFEITAAYALGAMTRGALVGGAVLVALVPFTPLTIVHPLLMLFYVVMGGMMLGLIGILAGIWADKFDHVATITNFIITPLSFLSGTFYSVKDLPGIWHDLAFVNPFFYMIDGVRFAMTGYSDGLSHVGMVVLLLVNAVLWWVCQRCFATGWRLKA